jgi:hypothetical protein
MARIVCLAWLALSLCVQAVTVAWKVPFHSPVADLALGVEAIKLEKAPAESTFFKEGDELWDISAAIYWDSGVNGGDPFEEEPEKARPWKGDWIVWNARSGMLVARGSWRDIHRLEVNLLPDNIPTIQRAKFEFIVTREGTAEPVRKNSITLAGRDGEEAGAEIEGFKLKVKSEANRQHTTSSNTLSFTWPGKEQGVRWELFSKFTTADGIRTRIAKGRDREVNWELFATTSPETADGTPINGERWIEGPAGAIPWVHYSTAKSSRRNLAGDLLIANYRVPASLAFLLEEAEKNPPFVDGPANMAGEVRGPFLDMRTLCRQNGAKFESPAAWVGFDPRTLSVVAIADREDQDLIEAILSMGSKAALSAWVETNPESGGWGLLSHSGEKGSISWTKEGESYLACDFEPTIGGNDQVVDLRFQFDVVSDREKVGRLHSASTLFRSRPQLVGSFAAADGKAVEVIVTVDIDPR